jgi:biotin carboxyl carrier protein
MKMETVIRSPQKGVVKKLAHKEGVSIPQPYVVISLLT